MQPLKPPPTLGREGRTAFRRLVREMAQLQGLEPMSRLAEIEDYGRLADEQMALLEMAKSNLIIETRIRVSRRISGLIGEKTRLRAEIMKLPPKERRLGKKEIQARRAAEAMKGAYAPGDPPRTNFLAKYLGEPEPREPDVLDRLLGNEAGEEG